MRVVSLIPARGGSKGIPRKNLLEVGGLPLVVRAIETSLASRAAETWVSTEDKEIGAVAVAAGAMVLDRPTELAGDSVSTEDVLLHFAECIEFDAVVLIQCTCPFSLPEDIDAAIRLLEAEHDSALTVTRLHQFVWKGLTPNYDPLKRPRRQDAPKTFLETGGLFATTRPALRQSGCRLSGRIGFVEVPRFRSIDIDTQEDLELARAVAACFPLAGGPDRGSR